MDTRIKNVMKMTMSKYSLDARWKCENKQDLDKSWELILLK